MTDMLIVNYSFISSSISRINHGIWKTEKFNKSFICFSGLLNHILRSLTKKLKSFMEENGFENINEMIGYANKE